jgi:hypothetical protein
MKWKLLMAACAGAALAASPEASARGGTKSADTLTYQGRLLDGGSPADGLYDLRFTLYSAPTMGSVVAGPLTVNAVIVNDGLFTVQLDFSEDLLVAMDADPPYLFIEARPAGMGGFNALTPRQPLTVAPRALAAQGAVGEFRIQPQPEPPGPGLAESARVLFGPTDDCSIGISSLRPGLLLYDPFGVRICPPPTIPGALPRLLFGPDDLCLIMTNPQLPGLIVYDPWGLRICRPPPPFPPGPTRILFGPTDDCSIGIDPNLSGLIERDPIGLRLLGPNDQGCRLLFGPTDLCTVEVDPLGPTGLLLRDPSGIRLLDPDPVPTPTLRFGPTDDCLIMTNPSLPGLIVYDPSGLRICRPPPPFPDGPTRILWGPTDDCTIGIDPVFPGLVERDPVGLRLLGADDGPGRLIFGPTDDCSISVNPPGLGLPEGLLLYDPRGVRICIPTGVPTGFPTLLFGPTDDCAIGLAQGTPGLHFRDPSGFWFLGGPVSIGTGPTPFLLAVNGNAAKPGGGTWAVLSDERTKKNIERLDGSLDRLLKLEGVSFEYIDTSDPFALPGRQVGMVAQQVEKEFPDWVEEGSDGRKYLAPRGMEALVVEAMRDLRSEKDSQIEQLRREKDAEIAALQDRISRLEAAVEAITGGAKGGVR